MLTTKYYVLAHYYPISGVWRSVHFSTSRKYLRGIMPTVRKPEVVTLQAIFPLESPLAVDAMREWGRKAIQLCEIEHGVAA